MSIQHPVFAVTGASGAGTSTMRRTMENIFRRDGLEPAIVEGDGFHVYERDEMQQQVQRAEADGRYFSHFGPEANHFDKLEALFRDYGETAGGWHRYYLHSEQRARRWGQRSGTFTPWQPVPAGTDLLFYEGLHGGIRSGAVDVAGCTDLLVGVVPTINLEWIQKMRRDQTARGYSTEAIMDTVIRRMHDYVYYVTPQFSRTHINFQRVPTVDTSNPFIARDIPSLDESLIVIRFRDPKRINVDFQYLLAMIHDSFMSRRNTIVVPGGRMGVAMEIILQPLIESMVTTGTVRYG